MVKSFLQIILFKLFHVGLSHKSPPQEHCPGCAGDQHIQRKVSQYHKQIWIWLPQGRSTETSTGFAAPATGKRRQRAKARDRWRARAAAQLLPSCCPGGDGWAEVGAPPRQLYYTKWLSLPPSAAPRQLPRHQRQAEQAAGLQLLCHPQHLPLPSSRFLCICPQLSTPTAASLLRAPGKQPCSWTRCCPPIQALQALSTSLMGNVKQPATPQRSATHKSTGCIFFPVTPHWAHFSFPDFQRKNPFLIKRHAVHFCSPQIKLGVKEEEIFCF